MLLLLLLLHRTLCSKLYWVDYGGAHVPIKIASANLDGSEPSILVRSSFHQLGEIAIDVTGNRLFWTEAATKSVSYLPLMFVSN